MSARSRAKPRAKPAANEDRGEVSITLGEIEYVMRPSYEAILDFEAATGKSLLDLARQAESGTLSTSDAATIVTGCIQAWGKQTGNKNVAGVNARKIGELVIEAGVLLTVKRLQLLLFLAVTGGVNAKGEVQVSATNTATTTTPAPDAE